MVRSVRGDNRGVIAILPRLPRHPERITVVLVTTWRRPAEAPR